MVYDNETIEHLNNKGLYIFLWEILTVSNDKNIRLEIQNTSNYEYLTTTMNTDIVRPFYSFELNSIDTFVRHNSLTNVSVLTFEYDTAKLFQPSYNNFTIISSNNMITCYEPIIDCDQSFSSLLIEKKFLFLSLRYEVHRHLLASYLVERESILTWRENHRDWHVSQPLNLRYLNQELLFDLFLWQDKQPEVFLKIKDGNDIMSKFFRIKLDSEQDIDINCGASFRLPVEEIAKCFCNVVAESTFQRPFPSFSEKVINSILTNRPFILASTPYSLEYLKKLGFRTFDQWWDESYDHEEDHEKRILKIFEVIDFIDSHDLSRLKKIYDEMHDVFEHNKEKLKSLKNDLMIFK